MGSVIVQPASVAPDGFANDLRLKYRTRKNFTGGAYKGRSGNCHQSTPKFSKSKEGNGVRRRSYFTHIPVVFRNVGRSQPRAIELSYVGYIQAVKGGGL